MTGKQPNHYQKIVEKAKYLMESNIYRTVILRAFRNSWE
jgi:hypothetical protein